MQGPLKYVVARAVVDNPRLVQPNGATRFTPHYDAEVETPDAASVVDTARDNHKARAGLCLETDLKLEHGLPGTIAQS